MEDYVKAIDSKKEMEEFIDSFRPLALNDRKNKKITETIEIAVRKCRNICDKRSLVNLYYMKIARMEDLNENMQEIIELIHKMRNLSKEINYEEGLSLSYNRKWYVEKFKGNKEESKKALDLSIRYISQKQNSAEFAYHTCYYSYAIEQWLEKRDTNCLIILEDCATFFHQNQYFQSFAKTLCILIIIYQQTQNKEKSLLLVKKILSNYNLLHNMPKEIQSIVHYFIGVGHKLSFNLSEAKKHLLEAERVLKPVYKISIYSGYYLRGLSHLTATYALQGRLELALKQMKEVEELIEENIATRNLDPFSKRQIKHDFNLTKFYIKSRLQSFQIEDLHELVQYISDNIEKQHSDAIFFSEFLLNANLTQEQLIRIRNLNNPSTKRVEHIINFLIENTTHTEEQQIMKFISILKKRPVENRMTFAEKAFADLLAAREYYKINRFTEIYPLLKKYENNLHKIEVLEMRVFMEAFIQVGAYKNGDPLGPALQYMAIKKCRQNGFSRLENKLLDYLRLQGDDTIRMRI